MNGATAYRKLPGASGMLLKSKLWLGPDHVMHVRRSLFSEEYRRYYFRDIQALVLIEKDSLALYFYVLAGMVALGAGLLLYNWHPAWAAVTGVLAAFVAMLGWQNQDCICALKTAVSNDVLWPLGRLRYARPAIALLRDAVEAVQGAWTGDVQPAGQESVARPEAPIVPEIPLRHEEGLVHVWLFGLMLFAAAIPAFEVFLHSTAITLINSVIGLAIIALVIFAAIKQRGTDLPRAIRRVVAASVVWLVASVGLGMVLGVVLVASMDLKHPNQKALERHPAMVATRWVSVAAYGALGSVGLALTLRHRRRQRTPPPLTLGT